MALTFKIEPEQRAIFCFFEGVVSPDKLYGYVEQIRHHPAFEPDFVALIEVNNLEVEDFSFGNLAALKNWYARTGPAPKIAIVVTKMLHFGIGRMFEQLTADAGFEFRVFRNPCDARAWLGLPIVSEGAKPGQTLERPSLR